MHKRLDPRLFMQQAGALVLDPALHGLPSPPNTGTQPADPHDCAQGLLTTVLLGSEQDGPLARTAPRWARLLGPSPLFCKGHSSAVKGVESQTRKLTS